LQPIIRRVWAKKGLRPIANQNRKYEWVYVYAFVQPKTGKSHWLIMPTVSIEAMTLALADFSNEINTDGAKEIVLLIDQAGFHQLSECNLPDGLRLYKLPPYTPELQPAEPLWPLLREAVANKFFKTIDDLEAVLSDRCNWLFDHPETVIGAAGFDWASYAI
jgi:hypothetical protein